MKNKLIFRIIGALASALIAVSVFIPFISVTGYSQSLWQANESVGTLYLPIMIIIFGVIGIIVFSTGFKTELAYASAGALVFFLILQTIPIINQGSFKTLSIGYYGLAIGVVLIIVMAFLCGLKVKQKVAVEPVTEQPQQEVSMIDQIDQLYNDNSVASQSNDFNSLDNIIQPLPVGDAIVSPIPVQNQAPDLTMSSNNLDGTVTSLDTNIPSINPPEMIDASTIVDNFQNIGEPLPNMENIQQEANVVSSADSGLNDNSNLKTDLVQTVNSVELNNLQIVSDPAVTEFNNSPVTDSVQTVGSVESNNPQTVSNPVVAEFNNSPVTDSSQTVDSVESNNSQTVSNPVVAEFTNGSSNSTFSTTQQSQTNSSLNQVQLETDGSPIIEPLKPLSPDKKIDVMADTKNTTSNLDIFG